VSTPHRRDAVTSRHIREFADVTRRLLLGSSLFGTDGAMVDVLVNPASGLLKTGPAHRRMMRYLRRLADARSSGRDARDDLEIRFHETRNREDAGKTAVRLVKNLVASAAGRRRLLVLAGGDGFHNDIGTALFTEVPEAMKEILIFRLPMGTGNDNSDAATVEEAFAILASASSDRTDALIEVRTRRGERHYAFNVVSFGLDAFVADLTNRMKKLAGPRMIYRIFADVAVLFYRRIWPLKDWTIRIRRGEEVEERRGPFLMTVFGRRGGTCYGGGMKVLPGDENFMLIEPLSLAAMLRIKPLFYRGAHRGLPIAEFFHADSLEMSHDGAILMETDGEITRIEAEDFPLVIRRIPEVLRILE